jgi:hypothetical protein
MSRSIADAPCCIWQWRIRVHGCVVLKILDLLFLIVVVFDPIPSFQIRSGLEGYH